MRKLALLCLFVSLGVFSKSYLHAQDYVYETGSPEFSTQIPIENGFINVNNGDIHMEIPLATQAQRGRLQLNEKLVYDSRIWKIVAFSGHYWHPTNVPNSMGGWTFSSGNDSGTASLSTYWSSAACNGDTIDYDVDYMFTWTDPQGTRHQFPSVQTLQYDEASVPPNCSSLGDAGLTESPDSSGSASDGSG